MRASCALSGWALPRAWWNSLSLVGSVSVPAACATCIGCSDAVGEYVLFDWRHADRASLLCATMCRVGGGCILIAALTGNVDRARLGSDSFGNTCGVNNTGMHHSKGLRLHLHTLHVVCFGRAQNRVSLRVCGLCACTAARHHRTMQDSHWT
jgi:hypothetical protein